MNHCGESKSTHTQKGGKNKNKFIQEEVTHATVALEISEIANSMLKLDLYDTPARITNLKVVRFLVVQQFYTTDVCRSSKPVRGLASYLTPLNGNLLTSFVPVPVILDDAIGIDQVQTTF